MPVVRVLAFACVFLVGLVTESHPAHAQSTALVEKASGKPASASSAQWLNTPQKGNDGDATTRWESAWRDNQWWQVDLGAVRQVSEVRINWATSYASKYRISSSMDGSSWTTAAEETATSKGLRTTSFGARSARYVRVTGITRATQLGGISFFEARVFGAPDDAPVSDTAPAPSEPSTPSEPSPGPSPLSGPLFAMAAGNPFTTPLPNSVPLHSTSEQDSFRNEFKYMLNASSVRVEQSQYSAAVFIVYRNGDVYGTDGKLLARNVPFKKPQGYDSQWNGGLEGKGWPAASWIKPDPGEGHIAFYAPETGTYGEFIYIDQASDGTITRYGSGGYIPDVRKSLGMSTKENPWWGGTAFGLNFTSFMITDHEIRKAVERYQAGDYANAYIPHLIGYEAWRHHLNQWHYPASKTDDMGSKVPRWGEGGDPNRLGNGEGILRMGGIIRLDPNINVQTQIKGDGTTHGDMMARIIARTIQKHGMAMTDQTKAGIALLAEHKRSTNGSWDTNSFNYGGGSRPWQYGEAWLKPMLTQLVDNKWMQFVYTGRNLEVDTGGSPPSGAYRPPS